MTKKHRLQDSCSLSIKLLPEFGWTFQGQSVYGPGSLFQGTVQISSSKLIKAERVRLTFQAFEKVTPYDVSPGIIRSKLSQMFGVQHVIWTSKAEQPTPMTSFAFPFTIQMPMVQFPPSAIHELYQCTYALIAVLDAQNDTGSTVSIKTQKSVQYMPFIETSLLKSPVSTEGRIRRRGSEMEACATVHAIHYVPGDTMRVSVRLSGKPATHVSLRLLQTLSILKFDDVPSLTKPVVSTVEKLHANPNNAGMTVTLDLTLPQNMIPTLNYSTTASISYELCILVQRKGPLGGIWSSDISMKLPITIGTLGFGVRASDELQLYTATVHQPDPTQRFSSSPKFMRMPEYEDALPRYESDSLPPNYAECISTCSGAITAPFQPLSLGHVVL